MAVAPEYVGCAYQNSRCACLEFESTYHFPPVTFCHCCLEFQCHSVQPLAVVAVDLALSVVGTAVPRIVERLPFALPLGYVQLGLPSLADCRASLWLLRQALCMMRFPQSPPPVPRVAPIAET